MAEAESTTQLDILGILFSGRGLRTVSSYEQNDKRKKMESTQKYIEVLELRVKRSVTENEKLKALQDRLQEAKGA